MAGAQQDASEAARELARARWGSQAVERAAAVVIPRAGELSEAVRAALHEATGPAGGEPDGEG
jgi:hypothetical protein